MSVTAKQAARDKSVVRAHGCAGSARNAALQHERVLLEIARLALCDPRRLFDAEGKLLAPAEWPDETAAAVASLKVKQVKGAEGEGEATVTEVRFWDKGRHLELAARHLGLLNDKLEIAAPVSELIVAARRRLRAQQAGGDDA